MPEKNSSSKLDQIVATARQSADDREKGYRARALKQYPWICGRCAREFDRSNLQELTVHHRDHNHDNNPEDGSNWELLCIYCHDNEHSRQTDAKFGHLNNEAEQQEDTGRPFADLASLLKKKQ